MYMTFLYAYTYIKFVSLISHPMITLFFHFKNLMRHMHQIFDILLRTREMVETKNELLLDKR
jgi:hypothetical protein